MRKIFIVIFAFSLSLTAFAQKKGDAPKNEAKKDNKKWDVTKPEGAFVKETAFTVSEGTWMNLDVSPDGKEIVFDLLGDIYIMPVTGGEARCIASGLAYEIQPRFSPDGKFISFTSDREGGDNIWYMKKDGSEPKQITKEKFRLLNNAVWTKDGKYIIARKHFTAGRSLGAGEMWMYHLTGGDGLQLTKKRTDQKDTGEPCLSPDNRYLYYSDDATDGSYFEYNKDPNGQIYVIRRYDMEKGTNEVVTGGSGGACRPQISPDGKKMAFIRRVRAKSVLYIHDLETGEEYPLFDKLIRDQQETWAIFGVYPNFGWMPDGKEIIIYGNGKFYKVNTEKANVYSEIPFKANVKQSLTEAVNFKQTPFRPEFEAKMIRHAITSPDGKKLVFNAAGHLYVKNLPDGTPVRLTQDSHFEFEPSFSNDGKWIVYTTWDDEAKGGISFLNPAQTGQTGISLSIDKGFYFEPQICKKGNSYTLIYRKGEGNSIMGYTYGKNPGIYQLNGVVPGEFNPEAPVKISEEGYEPLLSADLKKLYYSDGGGLSKSFKVLNLETKEVKTLVTTKYGKDFTLSPDGNWIAFTELYQAYVVPLPGTGQSIDLSAGISALPIKKVSRDAGTSLHWSGDSKTLHWVLGPRYFSRALKDCFTWVEGAKDSLPPIDTVGTEIHLKLKSDVPDGKVALINARIITMEGDKVIENGYILIEKNRIVEVASGNKVMGMEVKVIDCAGKTIIPGLVDVHAHLGANYGGVSPQQQWSYLANLAYGVTTTHDPSNDTEMVFSQAEMVEAGEMIGPRIFSTGTILYGADGDFKAVVNSLDDARSHLRRMNAVGAFSVKSYNQPRREQRQQILQAARELKMNVYPEGGSTFFHNMTQVADGHTGVEHSIPVAQVYEDVHKFWGASKVGYTPTLIVGYGGIWGENYWYDKTNVWENQKLLKYTPRAILDERSRRRVKAPDEEYGHLENTKACTQIAKAGTKINLGAHGQLQGLGAHWELWMIQQGGMSNLEALRCGTQNGAD
ncbi:MAG: amidohydrolase, partial [Bacteroidia bacterium]|nr:amidohydrolase [Bacteroidia bacterium]